jgi:hypothetical protein
MRVFGRPHGFKAARFECPRQFAGAIESSVKNMAAPKSMRFLTPERGRRGRPNLI